MRNALSALSSSVRRLEMITTSVAGAMLLTVTSVAVSASTVLEYNFNTSPSGTDLAASSNASGASGTATVTGTASIVTGANASLPGGSNNFLAGVGNGYLNISRTGGSTDTSGLIMKNTAGIGDNSEYRDYLYGTPGYSSSSYFGSSTLLFVYQPGNASMNSARHAFFSVNASGTTSASVFLYSNSSGQLQLDMGMGGQIKGSVNIATPTWDTSKWYVIAASWSTGNALTIYWQELKADPANGAGSFASAGNLANGTEISRAPAIGVREIQGGTLSGENAEGKLAYFLWTDQYTSNKDSFDTLVNNLYANPVPEVSSLVLLSFSVLTLISRRRF